MTPRPNQFRVLAGFTFRSTLLNVVTYMVIGGLSYYLVAHRYWEGPEAVPRLRNPQGEFGGGNLILSLIKSEPYFSRD